ncbi:MAG: hypothetical protein IPL65_12130 [Lewinellaceae bacterium]|nr:hypothetical protein [Lewinellaceae bacterium]
MNPVLIRLVKQLSSTDMVAICHFAACPLFNRRKEVGNLCRYLEENLNLSNAGAFLPERLFAAAYPGEPFDAARLRHVLSYVLSLVRKYLAWSEWSGSEVGEQPFLLQALRVRGLDFMFEKELPKAKQKLDSLARRDAHFHLQQYQLLQEEQEYITRRARSGSLTLQPLPDALSTFYLSDMLRHACVALTHQAIAGRQYDFKQLEMMIHVCKEDAILKLPAVAVYFHAYHMLKGGDDSTVHFFQLKDALQQHGQLFQAIERRGLYLMAINGCIRRMNAGQREFVREAFDLYREALDQGFLQENGQISGFTYKNIIRLGLALQEDAWVADFLETGKVMLHPKDRENLYRFNLAYLHFHAQRYELAMPLLQQIDLEDTLNNLEARRLLLRSYFELQEWNALEALLQSFGAYLRRQKNLGYHRATHEKLLHFTRRLMEAETLRTAEKHALHDEIVATTEVAERAWLLQKCGIDT